MHCFDDEQKNGFELLIDSLAKRGYVWWVMFDNFGEVVLRSDSVSNVIQLGDYVWRLNTARSTRTVHYFDILACSEDDVAFADSVVRSYLKL